MFRFWGRFAIRSNLSKTVITDKPHEFFDLASDPMKEILSVDMLNETTAHVVYNVKDQMVEEIKTSNIFVAIWTTSQARLRLYSYMEQIADTPGCQLLYTDTGKPSTFDRSVRGICFFRQCHFCLSTRKVSSRARGRPRCTQERVSQA